ncbi:DUF4465 domain-containing protein [Coprobacter sp.]
MQKILLCNLKKKNVLHGFERSKVLLCSGLLLTSLTITGQTSVTKVLEYVPAPGQFVNASLPKYETGDTDKSIQAKIETTMKAATSFIGLGAYGGYVIVGFDKPIVNVPGEYDFKTTGNAYVNNAECGIIMVSQDKNGNGIPDDEWYELAGSEYSNPKTVHNYKITYYRPQYDIEIRNGETPDINYVNNPASFRTETENNNIADVKWEDNLGNTGYVLRNTFHKQQSYYPMWIESDELTFSGSLLPENAVKVGNIWQFPAYGWGYADNWSANDPNEKIGMKIDWAVDKYGNPVHLTHIDFVKVYTALNQYVGSVGETSTELKSIVDLHPDAQIIEDNSAILDLSGAILNESNVSNFVFDTETECFDFNNLFRFTHTATDWGGTFSWDGFICSKQQPDLNEPSDLYNPDGSVNANVVSSWEKLPQNTYAAVTGSGVKDDNSSYIFGYWNSYNNQSNIISFADGMSHKVKGMYVTNSAINYISMKYGDSFGKKFGGANGTDPDYLKLTAIGKNGDTETGSVDFYLADYRSEYSCDDYIITDWSWMDLSSLGEVSSIEFVLTSSDNGEWGMNTPTYFCLDGLSIDTQATIPSAIKREEKVSSWSVYPNPAKDYIRIQGNKYEKAAIYTLNGTLVRSVSKTENIYVGDLNTGLYYIRITNNTYTSTLKFIKQ